MRIREVFRTVGLAPGMAAGVLGLHLVGTVFESTGLVMLLPIFELIQSGRDAASLAEESRMWEILLAAYTLFNLPVTLPVLLATSFVAILVRQALVYFRHCYTAHVQFTLIRRLRDRAFRGFLAARLGRAEDGEFGRTINDLTVETQVAVEMATTCITAAGFILLAAVYVGILFAISVPMTAAAIGVVVAAVLPLAGIMRRGRRAGLERVRANSDMLDFLTQRLKTIRLIRLSGTEAAELDTMRRHTGRQYERWMRSARLLAGAGVVVEPIMVAAALVFLYLASTHFGLAIEQIGVFLLILVRLVPVVKEMVNVRYHIANNMGSVETVERRLDRLEGGRERDTGTRVFRTLREGIAFERVTFRYDGAEKDALRDISVEFPAGAITALVGPSGAGKSSLVDLLPRLREPNAGQIMFDRVPATTFSLKSLRNAISYAPQAPQLFNVSVLEHIRYGRADAGAAEVARAARLAGAHGFIEALDDGYETIVGESGARLSGGQRQRLDLARAILKGTPILILDEPTSQLDADSEHEFRCALERIHAETDLTIVIVAHRLSTVRIAEKIVVMRNGRITDMGTHTELIRRGGWYAGAVRKQQLVEPTLAVVQ